MNKSIKTLTKARLMNQQLVPKSPGCLDRNDNPLLCLGAALVASHIHLRHGAQAADTFANYIVREPSSKAILDVASESGFPVLFCRHAIITNDECTDSNRKGATLRLLEDSSEI